MRPVNFHLDAESDVDVVLEELRMTVESLIAGGAKVDVMVSATDSWVSLPEAARQLGFSREHARRLIDEGRLDGAQPEGSGCWWVSKRSIAGMLASREDGWRRLGEWSKSLDDRGVPFG